MANDRIKWDSKAIAAMLKGSEVQGDLKARVQRAAARAGDGYEAKVSVGRSRALAMVSAETVHAVRSNAKNHTLMTVQDEMR